MCQHETLTVPKASRDEMATLLEEAREKSRPDDRKIPSYVPHPFEKDLNFTGRSDVIEDLAQGFQKHRRMALVGWAGIGKSQIAIEYPHRAHEDRPALQIFWVRGARHDTLLKSRRDLSRKTKLSDCDNPDVSSGKILSDWLSDPVNGEWLMVLDSVDDETTFTSVDRAKHSQNPSEPYEDHYLYEWLPQVQHGSIHVTSRNRAAARDIVNEDERIISVDIIPGFDALLLLRRQLPRDKSSDEDPRELLRLLEQLPLAITQAAAFVSEGAGRMTISRYLNLFRSDQVRYLERAANNIRRDANRLDKDLSESVLKHGTLHSGIFGSTIRTLPKICVS